MYRYLLIALLLIPLAHATEITTDSFSAEKFHTGSSGGTPETASATSRSTTTYQQGSNDEGETASTTENIGWYARAGRADLIPITLQFNNTNPGENENITINSTILNNGSGTANNFIVQFFDGLCGSGTQINGNITISQLKGGENTTVNITYVAFPVGPHNISVCVDVTNTVAEGNETNNNLTQLLNVKAYNNYYGELSGNVTLDNNLNQTEYDWAAVDGGNVYFIDADASVDFQSLQALGRNITGQAANTDFSEADTNLNMSGFNDSIQVLWAINASLPKQTTNFTVFGDIIENVPIINSTNSSNFITGILWDTSDDSGGEYDTTDREDLVFIARINRDQAGGFGNADYEAHVPVLLRDVNSTTSNIQFFVELR